MGKKILVVLEDGERDGLIHAAFNGGSDYVTACGIGDPLDIINTKRALSCEQCIRTIQGAQNYIKKEGKWF